MTCESRVLLLALRGRDAEVLNQLLKRDGHECVVCASVEALAAEMRGGAGLALITEESLPEGATAIDDWLADQPPWSDFPFILLATKRTGRRPREAQARLERMGNVVVLERPIHGETLTSAVVSALRVRRRQYEARSHLEDLKAAEGRLTQLNATLEARIGQRTAELSAANNRLVQEVSDREQAQAALAQSQKMEAVGQLTGGIAHDFNNLLTVIFGNLEMIQRRTAEERTAKLAHYAQQAADRAAKLTHQLLAFSRTQRLHLVPTDLNNLVLGMSDMLDRTIGSQVLIEMDLDRSEPWALADNNQLELAILNLAINARDAMEQGGRLSISTRPREAPDATVAPGRYGVVSVTDNGSGIPGSLIDKVFDPFFTTKPVGKGTGLGLSQVYGIAQQSGGTVRIHSVEGEGTCIEIWLPSAEPTLIQPSEFRLPEPAPGAARQRVLVIDDDDGVRRFIVDCLESAGYEVASARTGVEGLSLFDTLSPQLLIVDYAMPEMNGVEVIKAARTRQPGLPIILATGYADMDAVDQVIPAERVLRKPFRIDELHAAVHAAI